MKSLTDVNFSSKQLQQFSQIYLNTVGLNWQWIQLGWGN